jgi:hypothetical protein
VTHPLDRGPWTEPSDSEGEERDGTRPPRHPDPADDDDGGGGGGGSSSGSGGSSAGGEYEVLARPRTVRLALEPLTQDTTRRPGPTRAREGILKSAPVPATTYDDGNKEDDQEELPSVMAIFAQGPRRSPRHRAAPNVSPLPGRKRLRRAAAPGSPLSPQASSSDEEEDSDNELTSPPPPPSPQHRPSGRRAELPGARTHPRAPVPMCATDMFPPAQPSGIHALKRRLVRHGL